jgi:RNA-splicing ligase RtcB
MDGIPGHGYRGGADGRCRSMEMLNKKLIHLPAPGLHTRCVLPAGERYHNFALAAGVFVHNCGMIAVRTQFLHKDSRVWLSRKGAVDASEGKPGLIPRSMGTRSYVVRGKGSRLSLNSAPHGAGRRWSRSAARKRFTRQQLDSAMQGIE